MLNTSLDNSTLFIKNESLCLTDTNKLGSLSQIYQRLSNTNLSVIDISIRADIEYIYACYSGATDLEKVAISKELSGLVPNLLDKFFFIDNFDGRLSRNFKYFIKLLNLVQPHENQVERASQILEKIIKSDINPEITNKIIVTFSNLLNSRVNRGPIRDIALTITDICIQKNQCDENTLKHIFYILGKSNSFLEAKKSDVNLTRKIKEKIFQLLKQSTFSTKATSELFQEFLKHGKIRHGKNYVSKIIDECIKNDVNLNICNSARIAPTNSTISTFSSASPLNITSFSLDDSITFETKTEPTHHYFSTDSKLANSFGLGILAGSFDGASHILLHIAKNKGCSTSTLKLLKVTLAIANSFSISILPLIYSIVENLANENNPIINSEKVVLLSYAFVSNLALRGLTYGIHHFSRNYLEKRPITKVLTNLLPFLACLWMLANGEESIMEGLSLAGISFLGAIIPSIATQTGLYFFSSYRAHSSNALPSLYSTQAPASIRLSHHLTLSTREDLKNRLDKMIMRCDELHIGINKIVSEESKEKEMVMALLTQLKGLLLDNDYAIPSEKSIESDHIEKIKQFLNKSTPAISEIQDARIQKKIAPALAKLNQEINSIQLAYITLISHEEGIKKGIEIGRMETTTDSNPHTLYDTVPFPRPVNNDNSIELSRIPNHAR